MDAVDIDDLLAVNRHAAAIVAAQGERVLARCLGLEEALEAQAVSDSRRATLNSNATPVPVAFGFILPKSGKLIPAAFEVRRNFVVPLPDVRLDFTPCSK